MADSTFDVIFHGQLMPGADGATVRANLAKLFKVDAARVEAMFSGQAVVVKKNVDAATAQTYASALNKAGAAVQIISNAPQTVVTPAAASSSPAPSAPAPTVLSMAEPGVTLIETTVVAAPTIDTSSLSLAAVGVDLVERVTTPVPQYDLSQFKLDPPGTMLTDAKPAPPANIDTSGLSLANS